MLKPCYLEQFYAEVDAQFALPFFTVLEPSSRCCKQQQKKRHKTTMDWSCQMIMQLVRWVSDLPFILVGDGGFATGELAWTSLFHKIALVSRLKMNAGLYDFPLEKETGNRGRPAKKGKRLMNFKQMLGVADLYSPRPIWPLLERLRHLLASNVK